MAIDFLKRLEENAVKLKDMPFLFDDENSKGYTYGQAHNIAGKVYSYLEAKNVGKDDFVLICLPRGAQPIIAMYGVWRAGAAAVIVEDNYAPERIEFIKKDCDAKVVIDSDVWTSIQICDSKEGYVEPDLHDAAFAVYTSGTTGNPKGVVHEYGNLDRMMLSVTLKSGIPLAKTAEDRFALVAPLNFVASTLIICVAWYLGITMYVVAYSVLKNPLKIGLYLIKNKITGTFLTPSYIRKMDKAPGSLNFCIIGSEPANEVFLEGMDIHNFYLMSESGFAVTHFLLDKKYEFTPVGNSEFDHNIMLLDEQGNEVADGEEGEICFENNYVRGYLNLPEQTEEVFKINENGDKIYHTGDIARKDEQGRFIICGRLNDMVKINGNRVEPGEIENVTMKVLGVDWAAARVFDNGDRVYVCAYYKQDIGEIDFETTRKKMEQYLPYYMLPSYFIKIDEVPLRPNGKMDRKALPAPDVNEYRADYIAPRDDTEKAIVEAMEKALKLTQIGVNDDFYQLGGDSMTSIEVIKNSGLPGLSSNEIFRGHTPAKIAALYKENHINSDGVSIEEKNEKAMKVPHFLTAEQKYMVDYQLYTPMSTMYNLFQMLKLDKDEIDIELMADAVDKAVYAHPALLTAFSFNEDGEMIQSYRPDLYKKAEVEKVTEEELDKIKQTLVKPFKIVNSSLIRLRLFETEEAAYLFFDVHHTIFDGTSSKVFFGDILAAYAGQDLEPDYYYAIIAKREELLNDIYYYESKGYFEGRYSGKNWSYHPDTDHETRENEDEETFQLIPASNDELTVLDAKYKVSPNAFFITTSLLATAMYNKKKDIMLSWIYNGRSDISELSSVGLLFRDLPVAQSFDPNMKLVDLYADINAQINGAIEHSIYPYIELDANCVSDDHECVLYQDNLREMDEVPGLLGTEDIPHNGLASQNVLDLEILNTEEGMQLMLDYASSRYDASSIESFGKLFNSVVRALLVNTEKASEVTIAEIVKTANKFAGRNKLFSKDKKIDWMK